MTEQTEHTYDLFISYAGADRAWVEGYLLNALTQAGARVHSEAAFTLGVPRLLEFERAVQDSNRTLLVLSPAYLADNYGQFADLLAQTYGLETATWPVIPLILKPVKLPPRLAALQSLDATDAARWPEVIERLAAALQVPVPSSMPEPPCPYPGMVPFSESDSSRFFGRDSEAQELVERLYRHPFVAVIGPSGSGKSSLVFAGLVPALRESGLFPTKVGRRGSHEWLIRDMRPGEKPLAALEKALPGESPDGQLLLLIVDQFEEVFAVAREDATPFYRALLSLIQAPDCYVVLVSRADFYSDLMATPLWPEVQAHRLEVAPLNEARLRQAIVRPAEEVGVFVETALVERLVADAAGGPGVLPLVQETLVLLWEHLERRFLPVSAYEALILSFATYQAVGGSRRTGLQVAIARRADTILADLTLEQQVIARRIFLRLVQFGQGRADTRRQQSVAKLRSAGDKPRMFDQTLGHLTDKRLLTLSGEAEGAGRQVDIAHEALINGWPTLRVWLIERREAEQTRRRLEAKAAEWVRLGRGGGGLLDDVELLEADRWLASDDALELGYDESLPALVQASRDAIESARQEKEAARQRQLAQVQKLAAEQKQRAEVERQRAEEQTRAARRLRLLAIGLTIVFLLAAAAVVVARNQTIKSDKLRYVSLIQALAGQAPLQQERGKQDEQGALLARQAYNFDMNGPTQGQVLYQVDESLRAVLSTRFFSIILPGHERTVNAVAFSPDGLMLASGDDDHSVRLWDLNRPDADPAILTGHDGQVWSVAFSPDGLWLASGSSDGAVRLWDPRQPSDDPILLRERVDVAVFSIAFNPANDRILATGNADGVVRIWDLVQRAPAFEPLSIQDGDLDVGAVTFGPDGQLLAAGAGDGHVRVWDLSQPKPDLKFTLKGHEKGIRAVAFSPDGHTLATAGMDWTIRVWDLSQPGTDPTILTGHDNEVWSVQFAPDGQTLVSGSDDRTIRVWDLRQPNPEPKVLRGHGFGVRTVAISRDGQSLASGGQGGDLRLWEWGQPSAAPVALDAKQRIISVAFNPDGRTLASVGGLGHAQLWDVHQSASPISLPRDYGRVLSSAFSPDGRALALGGADGDVLVWGLQQLDSEPIILSGHEDRVYGLAFSPGGQWLASGSWDGTIRVWNYRQPGSNPIILRGHKGHVWTVAFSPDGQTLASGGDDATVHLWDLSRPDTTPISVLRAHQDSVRAVAFGPDGGRLASGGADETVRLWNLGQLDAEPVVLPGHENWAMAVAFSPDGRFLASGSADGTVRLWDPHKPDLLPVTLSSHDGTAGSVAFSPDGQMLASGGEDRTIRVWIVRTDSLADMVCEKVSRNLTQAEWNEFIGPDIKYERTCENLPPGEGVEKASRRAPTLAGILAQWP